MWELPLWPSTKGRHHGAARRPGGERAACGHRQRRERHAELAAQRPAAPAGAQGGDATAAGAALGVTPRSVVGQVTTMGHEQALLGLIAPTGLAVGLAR